MYYGIFREVRPGAVTAKGHLSEFLKRQKQGLSGNIAVQKYPFNTPMWDGGVGKVMNQSALYQDEPYEIPADDTWWPYEQSGYALDGLLRLGLLTDDQELIDLFKRNLDFVLSHPSAKDLLGHAYNKNISEWPMAVFFKAVIAYYDATHDERVLEAFYKHYSSLKAEDFVSELRHINNVEGLVKVYEWSGDEDLLKKAVDAYREHNKHNNMMYTNLDELHFDRLNTDQNMVIHGVSFSESIKLPILLYLYTGDSKYLDGAEAGLANVLERHDQPTGVPSSNEYLSGRDPLQGYETCLLSDFQWSLGYFLMASGNGEYADRIEKIVYNALPGSITKDFTALQYFSAPNQVASTPASNHSHFCYGMSPWRQYRPDHYPQCCSGNVHRAMPIYVMRMWLQDAEGAPVASLYGPSRLEWEYRGAKLIINEETEYPYDDTIRFIFHPDQAVEMPFRFRIPSWCTSPQLQINGDSFPATMETGKFCTINRTWKDGDCLELKLPMQPEQKQDRNWSYFQCGPLVFSYPVSAKISREEEGRFASYIFEPEDSWNFAVAPDAPLELIRKESNGYPLDNPPVELKVKAFRVSGYDSLDQGRFTPNMPLFSNKLSEEEDIRLVPFGSTILRVTGFPDGARRTLLPVFQARVMGPYPYDFRKPLNEQHFIPESLSTEEFKQQSEIVQPDSSGYYNLIHHCRTDGHVLAYVKFLIWSDRRGKAVAAVGASDGAEGFIDGEKVLEIQPPFEGEFFEPCWFDINIKKGWNELVLKVADGAQQAQYRHAWGARVTVFFPN